MQPLPVQGLLDWLTAARGGERVAPLLLDVREASETSLCPVPGALHIPMREVPARLASLDPAAPTVVLCHHGIRSQQVAFFLESRGFTAVYNLNGGVDAWSRLDASLPRY